MSKHTNAGKFQGRPLVPLIVVSDAECGPSMAALAPAQRAFVIGKVHHGLNNTEAAARAGYSKGSRGGAKVSGYRLAHMPEIVAAIIEESHKVLKSEGPNSIKTLVAIRDNPKAEDKDRIKAAVELLNRGGLSAVNEHHMTVEHKLTEDQLDRRILELARELGLSEVDARKMLVAPDRAIEGEFSEVSPPSAEDLAAQAERERENARRRELRTMTPEERETSKREMRGQRSAEQKRRYAEAQGKQLEIEDAIAGQAPLDDLSDILRE